MRNQMMANLERVAHHNELGFTPCENTSLRSKDVQYCTHLQSRMMVAEVLTWFLARLPTGQSYVIDRVSSSIT